MSDLPPPPDRSRTDRAGLHPVAIVLLIVLLAGVAAALIDPNLWWLIAVGIPIVGGALAAIGHAPADRLGRFLRGLWVSLAVEVAVVAITFGIVYAICTSMAQGVTG
jgi:hypothetical protein